MLKDLNIYKPTTTSRVDLSNSKGIKCVHYGDIYKSYDNLTIQSSKIINGFTKVLNKNKLINCDSIILPDVTETINDFGHYVYIEYDGTSYINGTHTFALVGESNLLKYIFYNLQSANTRLALQQQLKGDTVFQLGYKDLLRFSPPIYHTDQQEQQHIVDIRRNQ